MHKEPENNDGNYATVTATDSCKFQNLVTGQEFWFKSYGADAILKDVSAMNQVFVGLSQKFSGGAVTKSFLKDDPVAGKYNMIYLLMPNATDASVVSKNGVEGSFTYKGYEVNRLKSSAIGTLVHMVHDNAVGGGADYGVSFNIKDTFAYLDATMAPQTMDGDPMGLAGFLPVDAQGKPLAESYLTLNLGAFSLLLEYYTL